MREARKKVKGGEPMKDEKVYNVVLTGIMMCLVMVATMTIRIPVPFTQGYVHLGDTMIFLAVLVLGKRNATLAAGFGASVADLLSGYAYYAPWTLAVKALMAFVVGAALERMEKKGQLEEGHVSLPVLLAMFFGGLEMTVGYYVAASLMHGNWYTPLFSVPGNIGQFAVGMVLAFILAKALYKTPARKYFAIK